MSVRDSTTILPCRGKLGLRVFRVTFYCDECPNEFEDEMLTISPSHCPCCDKECQPDGYDEYEVETDEDEDDYLDPDRLREDRDDRLACLREIGGED